MVYNCVVQSSGSASVPLPAEVVSSLEKDDELSLAGTLLVMLGWAVEMDPCDGDDSLTHKEDAIDIREVEAQKIFERLQERSPSYQHKLYLQMLKLTSVRVEQLVVQALETHSQQQDADEPGICSPPTPRFPTLTSIRSR